MDTEMMVNNDCSRLLEVRNLSVSYGLVKALENVSFEVKRDEIVAMIGPNGAGKSTALKAVSGVLEATGGQITNGDIAFEGENIKGYRTDQLVKKGMSLIPEGRRVFPTMTVLENLEMGAYTIAKERQSFVKAQLQQVFDFFPDLHKRQKQRAGTLSSGEQQMLALGRALMLRPKLLLADEPSLGLSPNYIDMIFNRLVNINRDGISVLIVEQNASMALEIAHRGYVFAISKIVMEGSGKDLLSDDNMRETYLGI